MIYKKNELLNLINNILKENTMDFELTHKEFNNKIIRVEININKKIILCGKYEITYNFTHNKIEINIIKNMKELINLPLYLALYINPIKEEFKIFYIKPTAQIVPDSIIPNKILNGLYQQSGGHLTQSGGHLTQSGGHMSQDNQEDHIEKTSIDRLKTAHRYIKKYNMDNVVKLLKTQFNFNTTDFKLLDIGSGKGNDLTPWLNLKIKKVIGIDISEESIQEAKRRYNKNKNKDKIKVKYYKTNVGIYDQNIMDKLDKEIKTGKFHIITCNFMIHYLFESPENLQNLFKIISKYLITGGYFIGTAINKNFLLKTYNDLKTNPTPLLEINPLNNFFNNSLIYNRKYSIRIGKHEENTYFKNSSSVEYLVDFNELKRVAAIHNLQMIDYNEFKKIYFNLINQRKLRVKMSPEEEPASFLNCIFSFKKIK
jgi:2-polyprenyl-3-methyl-5-hydroxy-6-metoxy-1,4-benzoquinol methylase